MIRNTVQKAGIGVERDFRWRGGEVSRIEAFSDAVFAFSVTLLVVSLEVPKTFNDLMTAMQGFAAFTLSFALLVWIWYNHYIFFRRYGLQDTYTIVLNAVLLFVILFYIYPLKFLATLIVDALLASKITTQLPNGSEAPMIEIGQTGELMVVYGLGFFLVFLCFALLFAHAYKKRDELALSTEEAFDTVTGMEQHLLEAGIGLVAIVMAVLIGDRIPVLSSLPYWLIGPVMTFHGSWRGKKKRRLMPYANEDESHSPLNPSTTTKESRSK